MKEFEGCHWLQKVVESLLVRLEEEELTPEAFRWNGISRSITAQDVKQVEVKLDDLGLKGIWPQLLGEG
jgi:hypothetical protein